MSYADKTFYKDTFKGTTLPDDVIEQQLEFASYDIDSLTYNRITKKGFNSLTEFQQDKIKIANCMQAEFLYTYGDLLDSPISGYGAGSTSVSFDKEKISGQNGITTSKRTFGILKQTGLTVRLFI